MPTFTLTLMMSADVFCPATRQLHSVHKAAAGWQDVDSGRGSDHIVHLGFSIGLFCNAVTPFLLLLLSYHRCLRMTLRSAGAECGRRTSKSQLVHGCSWTWLWWVGWGQGWRWWLVGMRDTARRFGRMSGVAFRVQNYDTYDNHTAFMVHSSE